MNPSLPQAIFFASAVDFGEWLEANHDSADELWVGYFKRRSERGGMTYAEAVDEALCFGWIDGLTRGVDEARYIQRFTPRRRNSNWSAVNIAKVAELTRQGRMHPAGLRAFEERDRRKDATYTYERPNPKLPPEMEQRLRANGAAWTYWRAQTPSYRRTATRWILDAKRAETRERRLAALVEDCAAGRPIKPMSYSREAERQ